jgi:cytochrome c biogenesis protein CcmG, thiol:disulfide interchange protein DsbE
MADPSGSEQLTPAAGEHGSADAGDAGAPAGRERRSALGRLLQIGAIGLVASLLALLTWHVAFGSREGARFVDRIAAGKKPAAPGFDLGVLWPVSGTWPAAARVKLDDGRLSLSELRGRPVVVNFWASWCRPCKKEAPILNASARRHAGRVAFLGIDVQDFPGPARRFLRSFRTIYPSVREGGSPVYTRYGLTGVPETYYIDRFGRAVAHSVGQVSRGELEAGIGQAVRSTGPTRGD